MKLVSILSILTSDVTNKWEDSVLHGAYNAIRLQTLQTALLTYRPGYLVYLHMRVFLLITLIMCVFCMSNFNKDLTEGWFSSNIIILWLLFIAALIGSMNLLYQLEYSLPEINLTARQRYIILLVPPISALLLMSPILFGTNCFPFPFLVIEFVSLMIICYYFTAKYILYREKLLSKRKFLYFYGTIFMQGFSVIVFNLYVTFFRHSRGLNSFFASGGLLILRFFAQHILCYLMDKATKNKQNFIIITLFTAEAGGTYYSVQCLSVASSIQPVLLVILFDMLIAIFHVKLIYSYQQKCNAIFHRLNQCLPKENMMGAVPSNHISDILQNLNCLLIDDRTFETLNSFSPLYPSAQIVPERAKKINILVANTETKFMPVPNVCIRKGADSDMTKSSYDIPLQRLSKEYYKQRLHILILTEYVGLYRYVNMIIPIILTVLHEIFKYFPIADSVEILRSLRYSPDIAFHIRLNLYTFISAQIILSIIVYTIASYNVNYSIFRQISLIVQNYKFYLLTCFCLWFTVTNSFAIPQFGTDLTLRQICLNYKKKP